jgi:hypothetical protein
MSCIDFVFGSYMDFRQCPSCLVSTFVRNYSKYTDIVTAVNEYDIRILELPVLLLKTTI